MSGLAAKTGKRVKRLPAPVFKMELPPAVKVLSADCDYAIVKFKDRKEAYKADGQLTEFKVINSARRPSQVHIHLRVDGCDKETRPPTKCRVDVDFYLPIPDFKRIAKLLQGVRFKRDKEGFLRASMKRVAKNQKRSGL